MSLAQLKTDLEEIPGSGIVNHVGNPRMELKGLLHQVDLRAIYNHPSGVFTQAQALWYAQDNQGYSSPLPGDDFWQFNLFAGWRFARRRGEVSLGVLNIAGRDYRLNPLNLYGELPRSRTVVVQVRMTF